MYKFKNINKEQHAEYINKANDLNRFNLLYEGLCLGCFYNNQLIGIIEYNPHTSIKYWSLKDKYPEMKITKIGLLHVKEEFRNKGIGNIILTEIFKRMNTGKVLVLQSDKTEKHRKFYIENGFVEVKEWIFMKRKGIKTWKD